MKIKVINYPKMSRVPSLLSNFLYLLDLPVDTSFDPDGTYHIPAKEIVDSLERESMPRLAHQWKILIEQNNWEDVRIPADCCEIISQKQTVGA